MRIGERNFKLGILSSLTIFREDMLPKVIPVILDTCSWVIAAFLATLLRYDGRIPNEKFFSVFILSIFAGLLSISLNQLFSIQNYKFEKASFEEVFVISLLAVCATGLLFFLRVITDIIILPRSVPIITGILALVIQLSYRLVLRQKYLNNLKHNAQGVPTLIYGAGVTGRQFIEQILINTGKFNPIGFLDDDKAKLNTKISGYKVLGNITQLENIVSASGAKILVIAINSLSRKNIIQIEMKCIKLGLTLKIIPTLFEILNNSIKLTDLSDLTEEKLLGRTAFNFVDLEAKELLLNKKILVVGAGGSIGSEISRQLHNLGNSETYYLDRDENALLNLQLSILGNGLFADSKVILADIRDSEKIGKYLHEIKPDIIFHAAALKHLSLLEKFPDEAYKTNVVATKFLISESIKNDVSHFVNISTDKAADPISELGKSKLITERIIAGVSGVTGKYISVRFGNVIGSNGSFLNTFRTQIQLNRPISVTHPDVSRYFMTVAEAVQLVFQSLVVGKCGETLILNMGDPVKIDDIAKLMIERSGKNVGIKYSGLRKGEKLHETLVGVSENIRHGNHPSILHINVEPLKGDRL